MFLSEKIAEQNYKKIVEEFSGFYQNLWIAQADTDEKRRLLKNGWCRMLSKISELSFEKTLSAILNGETDFAYPPTPAQFLFLTTHSRRPSGCTIEQPTSKPGLTLQQAKYFSQCDKNNPGWRKLLDEANSPLDAMLVTATAFYGGFEKIPEVQIKFYEMLDDYHQKLLRKKKHESRQSITFGPHTA